MCLNTFNLFRNQKAWILTRIKEKRQQNELFNSRVFLVILLKLFSLKMLKYNIRLLRVYNLC